jgi:hypothetical protein
MPNSACLHFPFQEDQQTRSLRRAETPNDAIQSAITAFLLTEKGQRRGNPIGSFLPSLQHKLIPSAALPGFADELTTELQQQFPGVVFTDVTLIQDLADQISNLNVSITFGTTITDVTQFTLII